YLDVEYDLSKVMFVCTANVLHTIPQPLQDRMEILRLPGYTEQEKLEIAKRFLVKRAREATGLTDKNLMFTDEGLLHIIRHYTHEAGVRSLEREIQNIARKMARKVVTDGASSSAEITPTNANDFLGVLKYREFWLEKHNEIGLTTGLAWTEVGGSVLATEATLMEGKGRLTLTGKLGCVKEKLLAAHRMGLRTVVLPKDNEKDLAEIPQEILATLTMHFVETMDEVLQIALERPTVPLEHAAVAPVAEPFVAGAEKDKSLTN